MGRRGPPPKPSAIREFEGDRSHRPPTTGEPRPRPTRPKMPRDMDPVAAREWRRVVPALERLGLLTEVDGAALESYCQAYAMMRRAAEAIAKAAATEEGLTYVSPQGIRAPIPEIRIFNTAASHVRAFCHEFGLTPSARVRMVAPGEEEEDDGMESLLAGTGAVADVTPIRAPRKGKAHVTSSAARAQGS